VGHLIHIDADFAARVAKGLGLATIPMAPPSAAPVLYMDVSPALRVIGKAKDTLEGR
jgi:catalase